jgi:DNA-binding SARP family transcriptional activator/tetratricopeptide (TPR) repeat protein
MGWRLQLLGVPRLAIDGRTIAVSWQRRSLALLAYLVTTRGVVSRDTAAFALWPDDDAEAARANLRRNLNLLRSSLPPEAADWIVIHSGGSIAFDRDAATTDVAAFEALAGDPKTFAEAVAHYGGDFMAPLDEPWVLVERERLRARYHALLDALVTEQFSARRFDEALSFARRIVADEPFREDMLRRIMAIRYAMGDRPGAISEFKRFRLAIERELNVEPMAETQALRDLILRGDPLPAAPDAVGGATAAVGGVTAAVGGATAAVGGATAYAAEPANSLLPFGGRTTAIDAMTDAWERAADGDGNVAFVSGEAGIGKTRLVAETLDRIVGSGARVLRGTTASPEALPYEAVLAAFSQAAPYLRPADLEPIWLTVLAPLVPALAPSGAATVPPPLTPERESVRTFEAMTRLLGSVARPRPVVLVLEDVQWAGPGTLAALSFIAKRLRGQRILVIVTLRHGESEPASALRRELCASGYARTIVLGPLSRDEALDALARLRDPPEVSHAAALVTRSDGNPLFLTELLREYPENRGVTLGAIGDLVQSRLERATAGTQSIARVAAICGATFDVDLLRAVLGWSDDALIDGLAELLARGFVRSTASHERGTYAFTHALVREAIGEGATPDEARRVHRIVARALEARATDAVFAGEIARHWRAAGEAERAAQAYAAACAASLRVAARDEAAALATAGLQIATGPRLRFELLNIRIESNLRRAASDALRADVAELVEAASKLDDEAKFVAAKLRYLIEDAGGDERSRDVAITALLPFRNDTAAPRRSAEIAELEARHAAKAIDFSAARAAAENARKRYAELGLELEELRVAMYVSLTYSIALDPVAAEAVLVPLQTRVVAAADPGLAMEYWHARSSAAHARNDAEATLFAAERQERAARDVGDRLMEAHAAWNASLAHGLAGRYTHAFRDIDRAADIYASIGASYYERAIQGNRAAVLIWVGRFAEAKRLLEENLADARARGNVFDEFFAASNLGVALLATGAHEARTWQRHALALAEKMDGDGHRAIALGDLGAAECAEGDLETGLAHLREAASLNAALSRYTTQTHDLALAARWDPDPAKAMSDARTALSFVEAEIDKCEHVPEILWCCAVAFERAGHASAGAYARRRGREHLLSRAAVIEDENDRRCFLGIAHHAALLSQAPAH